MAQEKKKYAEKVYDKWNNGVDRAFGNITPKDRLLILASNAAAAFCAFVLMLGKLPFSGKTFGSPLCDAFISASGRFALGAFAGAIYGAFTLSAAPSEYIILASVIIIRYLSSRLTGTRSSGFWSAEESPLMRLAASAVISLMRALMSLSQSGFSGADYGALIRTMLLAPAACAVMLLYFSNDSSRSGLRRALYYVSMSAVFFAVVYCSSGIRFAGANLGIISAIFLTLCVSYSGGAVWGCVIGALLGISASLEAVFPVAVIGVLSGLLFSAGVASSVGFSVAAGSAAAVLINGFSAGYGFIPEAVIAAAVSAPVLKYGFLPDGFPFPSDARVVRINKNSDVNAYVFSRRNGSERLYSISSALADISTESKRNGAEASTAMRVKAEFCESCPMSPICWESEHQRTFSALSELSGLYLSGVGEIKSRIPERLSERCIKLKDLCIYTEKTASAEKANKREDTVSGELDGLSQMLSTVAGELSDESENDKKCEERIKRTLLSFGMYADSIAVFGKTRKRVFLYGLKQPKTEEESEKLRKALSDVCGESFSEPVFTENKAIFLPTLRFSAENANISESKSGEPANGDRAISFVTDDGCYYSVLTDGMGSGEEASECAEYAASVLEKLLRCGVRNSAAVRMLGVLIKKRFSNIEQFSAIDIMKIDLFSGRTKFLKNGAAESYVLRGGAVYSVNARSMPIGITNDFMPEESDIELCDGDTVVMVSDGICRDSESAEWLRTELMSGVLKSPDALAEDVMQKAVSSFGKSDDMTVSVTKIKLVS